MNKKGFQATEPLQFVFNPVVAAADVVEALVRVAVDAFCRPVDEAESLDDGGVDARNVFFATSLSPRDDPNLR